MDGEERQHPLGTQRQRTDDCVPAGLEGPEHAHRVPRTSVDGKPAVYVTSNAGRTWRRLDRGLPRAQAWLTVMRQAMCADDQKKSVGLYFGTTNGEVWGSVNAGDSWSCIARHLPEIFSVTVAR